MVENSFVRAKVLVADDVIGVGRGLDREEGKTNASEPKVHLSAKMAVARMSFPDVFIVVRLDYIVKHQ